ncbi:MAG: radical SAM family heme chaperone HemW [Pseudomonadota bacterium]
MQQYDDSLGFGLYIHWPFCRSKCPYCDFNSHVEGNVDHERWRHALLAELAHLSQTIGRRPLTSIFFGGGTPSLMAPLTAAALIEQATTDFGATPDIEITLEANPTSVECGRLRDFKEAGVNRLSLGVQSLNDDALRFLGREHSAREALKAVDQAARLFSRFSFDLIYARPGQTVDAWSDELNRALNYTNNHLSVYQLTIEPGTRFFNLHQRGQLELPEDDLQADLFEFTRSTLTAAGLPPYEISNHAADGEACKHNLVYWRTGDYAGIGPGAHGRVTLQGKRFATTTTRMPRAWLDKVETEGHSELPRELISINDQIIEMMLMGLRLEEGVDLKRLEQLAGRGWRDILNAAAIDAFFDEGWLTLDETRLQATESGLQRLNAILGSLLTPLSETTPTAKELAMDG